MTLDITVRNVIAFPSEVVHDPEHREYTASNDELRVAAVGATAQEAIERFQLAAIALLLEKAAEPVEREFYRGPRRRPLVTA